MKTTYTLEDGGKITANSPAEFLTELRKSSKFESETSDRLFMKHFAQRIKIYNGKTVRTDDTELFFNDLKAVGFILQ